MVSISVPMLVGDDSGAALLLYRLDQTDSGRADVGGVGRLEAVHCCQGGL